MDYALHLLIQISVFAILALGQYLVLGRAGMLFVAQAALFAIGAYGAAIASSQGLPSAASLLVGTCAALVIGLPMGLPALRLRGDFLLVASLGLCEIVRSVLNNWTSVTGGAAGFMNVPALEVGTLTLNGPSAFAPLVVGVTAVCLMLFYLIDHSPYGSLLTAIGEDEEGVRALGKRVRRAKVTAIGVASAWAGLAGGIWASYISYLDPASFKVWESVVVLSILILGGSGRLAGALIGAIVLVLVPEVLRFAGLPVAVAGPLRQVLFGLSLILIIRFRPGGLLGPATSYARTT
jgi:branched-chain amino acid transport system permease protein